MMDFGLAKTSVIHQKSKFGFFDLFGDMGGLLDLTIIVVGLFLQPYNYSMFQFYSIKKIYKIKTPFRKLLQFMFDRNCRCFGATK